MAKENYHHENLKSELIEKGLKLLVEEGYNNFSLRKVAKSCGVSHTAPYRHFKNKDELVLAIALQAMQKFNRSLQGAVDKYPEDIKSQLREMGYSYVKFFVENPEYLELFFLTDLGKDFKDKNFDILTQGDIPFNTFYKAIQRYKRENSGERDSAMDENALVLSYWGLVHGIAILIAKKDFSYPGDPLELTRKILWGRIFEY